MKIWARAFETVHVWLIVLVEEMKITRYDVSLKIFETDSWNFYEMTALWGVWKQTVEEVFEVRSLIWIASSGKLWGFNCN